MAAADVETRLQALTNALLGELMAITPDTMKEIQFELVATPDGGADIGLLENYPDAAKVQLSYEIYTYASHYLPLVKQYVPGWRRSLLTAREEADGWKITVEFERGQVM
jgi:hypothetical protein